MTHSELEFRSFDFCSKIHSAILYYALCYIRHQNIPRVKEKITPDQIKQAKKTLFFKAVTIGRKARTESQLNSVEMRGSKCLRNWFYNLEHALAEVRLLPAHRDWEVGGFFPLIYISKRKTTLGCQTSKRLKNFSSQMCTERMYN